MGGGRDLGIDLSMAFALAAVLQWAGSGAGTDGARLDVWLLEGPPVFLLAMLLGAGMVLAARRRLRMGDAGGAVRAAMLRGLLLALLGLVLGAVSFAHWGFLTPIGVALAGASFALLLPTWAVVVLASLLAVIGGWVLALARASLPSLDHVHSVTTLVLDPVGTTADVLVTGWTPSLTMLTAVLIGVVVARVLEQSEQRSRRRFVMLGVAVTGAVLAAISVGGSVALAMLSTALLEPVLPPPFDLLLWQSWSALESAGVPLVPFEPWAGSLLEIARMAGLALLATGLIGALAATIGRRVRPWIEILRVVGCGAISAYVVLATAQSVQHQLDTAARAWLDSGIGIALHLVLLFVLLVVLQRRGEGPLEAAIDALAERGAGGPRLLVSTAAIGDDVHEFEVRLHAPIWRVWRAMTDPAVVLRWNEDPAAPILDAAWDVRPGGGFRWRVDAGFGGTRTLLGEFLQLDAPTAMVQSLRAADGPVMLTSHDRLFEIDGVTTLRTRNVYASSRMRDAAAASTRIRRSAVERLAAIVEEPGAMEEAAARSR